MHYLFSYFATFAWISQAILQANTTTTTTNAENTKYKTMGYFVNWAIYGRNFFPQNLTANELTHVLYAFANVNSTGAVYMSDTYADLEKHFATDSWNECLWSCKAVVPPKETK